jgi:hypothetical protein
MTYEAILPEIGTKTTQIKWRKKVRISRIFREFLGNLLINSTRDEKELNRIKKELTQE